MSIAETTAINFIIHNERSTVFLINIHEQAQSRIPYLLITNIWRVEGNTIDPSIWRER